MDNEERRFDGEEEKVSPEPTVNENTEAAEESGNGENTEASEPSQTDNAKEDESPKSPDYSHQSYTPSGYNGYEPQPTGKGKKKGVNGLAVAMTAICVVCALALAAIFGSMYGLNYDPENNGGTSQDTDESGESATDKDDKNGPNANEPLKGEDQNTSSDEIATMPDDTPEAKPDVSIEIIPTDGNSMTYGQVYELCSPAAVGIEVTQRYNSYFGTQTQTGVGSGFIVDEDGYIATNAHVVSEMNEIKVYLPDGSVYDATLVGCDDLSDLAVIKIEAEEKLPVLTFGDSSALKVGDIVTAIGTPADISLAGTFTQGIISAVDREIELTDDYGITKTMRLLQTDATINPGNSGGPLLNMHGQVIGINTLKLTEEFEGIGFAIPSVYAKTVVEQIIATGGDVNFDPDNGFVTVDETPSMGITECRTITAAMARQNEWPQGVQIWSIRKASSLYVNGARPGDIITEFNGKDVTTVEELQAERDTVKPRQKATVKIFRDGEYFELEFTMGSNVEFN